MNQHLRQTIIGLIWPGPIAGPLPLNLFRVLAPALVVYLKPLPAVVVMGILTSLTVIFYFRLLELAGGKDYVESLLRKLPQRFHRSIERRGPVPLFLSSLVAGVFTYAIFLKLLHYSKLRSEILLVGASFTSSLVWTGLFWGSAVEIFKSVTEIAF